jgi:2-haloacid dehalogenase
MPRREFLRLLIGAPIAAISLQACAGAAASFGSTPSASPPASRQRRKIRAICFDLFTLFDPRSVVDVATAIAPDEAVELCAVWRSRQFEYCFLRAAAGQYVDFRRVTEDALELAARSLQLTLSPEARHTLVDAYTRLEPWPDTRDALLAWKRSGLRLAPLANYSPAMIAQLLANAGLSELFDAQISTDAARTFKPDPRAYALGVSRLGLEREEIAFSAFGGWDAAGAKWFGYPTFWVNRLGVPPEALSPAPDGSGSTLGELATFVAEH